jgi:pimeloyl-ACP methyl ester carboxylesterase
MTRAITIITLTSLLGAGVAAAPAAASGPYQITATAVSQDGDLTRTEYSVSAGPNPLDRFKMVRLAKSSPGQHFIGSILLLPPLGTTFNLYEQRDVNGAPGSSVAEFFAERNIDVYGYSPRYEGITAGSCEAGLIDCSIMKTWGLQSLVDDVTFVRSQITALHPGTKLVIGGVSLGCMTTIAVVNAHPGDYDGAVTWEGMVYSANSTVRALNQGYCSTLQAQLAANVLYDDVGDNLFKEVTTLSRVTPDGITPVPLAPPGLTNHQALVAFVSVPTPGPYTETVPNEVLLNGSLAENRLFFASEPRLYETISRFASYSPTALLADITCSIAGNQSNFTSNLGAFTGPLLAIGGGHAFGAFMSDQIGLFGSTSKQFLLEPDFGHVDHFTTANHRQFVEDPIYLFALGVFAH